MNFKTLSKPNITLVDVIKSQKKKEDLSKGLRFNSKI